MVYCACGMPTQQLMSPRLAAAGLPLLLIGLFDRDAGSVTAPCGPVCTSLVYSWRSLIKAVKQHQAFSCPQVAEFVAGQKCTAAGFLPDGSCCAGYADGHVRLISTEHPPYVCWASRPHAADTVSVGAHEEGTLLVVAFR